MRRATPWRFDESVDSLRWRGCLRDQSVDKLVQVLAGRAQRTAKGACDVAMLARVRMIWARGVEVLFALLMGVWLRDETA